MKSILGIVSSTTNICHLFVDYDHFCVQVFESQKDKKRDMNEFPTNAQVFEVVLPLFCADVLVLISKKIPTISLLKLKDVRHDNAI